MCAAARANLALRHFDEAKEQLDRAIVAYPDFATAHDLLGDLHVLKGEFAEAISAFELALKLNPSQKHSRKKIEKSKQLMKQAAGEGRLLRAQMAHADKMRRAEQHERNGERKEAEAIYREILKIDPDHVEASRLLAGIAVSYEQYREAKVFLQHALELAPDYPRAWVDLANVQRELEEYDDALESAAQLIELSPEKAESYMVYASILGVAGRHEEAIETYEKALELNPDKASALCTMGHHLKTIGRQDEAIARYRQCIAQRPDHSESYWSLANLKTFRFEQREVEAMHQLLERTELSDESRSQIHNALGLEYEARGDYDRAFDNFAECNRVRRMSEFYDPVDTEDTHDRVIEQFSPAFFEQPAGEERSPAPIFIVGLPRSGSTLIEQILASHSQVDGTHELTDLSKVVRAMRRGKRKDMRFPEVVSRLQSKGWSRIGAQYLERTKKHRGNAPYFIDKNPNNFIFIGLLKLAVPNAKIINARRHPLDSCLGSFKQLFASGQPFSYELTELAEYYLQYQRLMDHWHRVLPGFVLDVHYEDVVGDLDSQVHRLLDFCGLPFEESCLRFHETRRAVKTASSEQVRQPIYSTSVNLWRNYEHRLETLIEVLEPLLRQLPETGQLADWT
jgi:tetratricopeptide (TPR) repeat protein